MRNVSEQSRRRIAQTPSKLGAEWRGSIGEPDIRSSAPPRGRGFDSALLAAQGDKRDGRSHEYPKPNSDFHLALLFAAIRFIADPTGLSPQYFDLLSRRKRAAAALPVRFGQAGFTPEDCGGKHILRYLKCRIS